MKVMKSKRLTGFELLGMIYFVFSFLLFRWILGMILTSEQRKIKLYGKWELIFLDWCFKIKR